MDKKWKKHVFTAELPYEKDAVATKFLVNHFEKVDDFIMSLGQMSNIPPSRLFQYEAGKLLSETTYIKNSYNVAGLVLYFYYIPKALLAVSLDLIRALKKTNFKYDIFFAQHFLPAYIAIILRRLGILKCQKIIFWMFDFFPVPPQIIRSLYYRGIDSIQGYIRKNVDEIWYTTPRLDEVDRERFGTLPKSVKSKVTHGCFFEKIKINKPSKIPPLRLAFLGSLRRNNAIYESVESVAACVEKGMHVELLIIGSGPEEDRLKKYVKQLKIVKNVIFYGFIDDGQKIAKIFSKCHLGMTLYPADPYGPNWYLTSGKFRRFISQGLPVVTSTVPYFMKYIYDYNAGLIVDNNATDVARALRRVYDNPDIIKKMQKGVEKLYHKFSTDRVFMEAFEQLMNDPQLRK